MKSKKCIKCKKIKVLNEFGFYEPGKHRNICKDCMAIHDKQFKLDHIEIYKANNKRWQLNNPEKVKSNNEQYYSENKEEIKAYKKQYRLEYPEKSKIYQRNRRATMLIIKENYTLNDEKITLSVFGAKCFKCGNIDKIAIDHHYPLSKGNALTITNAVPLCKSCNSTKKDKDPKEFYTKSEIKKINTLFKVAKLNLYAAKGPKIIR